MARFVCHRESRAVAFPQGSSGSFLSNGSLFTPSNRDLDEERSADLVEDHKSHEDLPARHPILHERMKASKERAKRRKNGVDRSKATMQPLVLSHLKKRGFLL